MNQLRVATAVLIVTWPVYIFTGLLIQKDFVKRPRMHEFVLRRGLVYLTLFVAAVTIIVDLITGIYNFLDGELSIRFYLKTLVVLAVAGGVFGFYFWETKRKDIQKVFPIKVIAACVSSIVCISVIAGFFVIGTPAAQRERKFDEQRVQDLQTLQGQIVYFWQQKERLPQNLDELRDSISGFVPPLDPRTQTSYEYTVLGDLSFELCAVFERTSMSTPPFSKEQRPAALGYFGLKSQTWEYKVGRTCFLREIDPELYKLDSADPSRALPY